MSNAFPPHDDCPIPSVEAIDGSLVSSCQILDPAPTIWEFPRDFPLPQPTNFNQGCFCLPNPSVDFGEAGSSDGSLIAPSFGVHIKYPNRAETGCCEPVLDFYIRLPAGACPAIDASAQATMTWAPTAAVTVDAERQPSSEADCGFDFDFNFSLPCVQFTIRPSFDLAWSDDETFSSMWVHMKLSSGVSSWIDPSGSSHVEPTDDSCVYDFSLGLTLPPPFCELTTELVQLVDPTVYDWCDLNATFISRIDSLEFEAPAGPGDPYNVILTYTIGVPWSGVVDVLAQQIGYVCPGDCCMTVPVISNARAVPGGPDCDSQTTIEFGISNVTLQWNQLVTYNAEALPACCEHFEVLAPLVYSTTGCGGQIQFATREIWIPHDAWTIPTKSPDELYSGGTFDGQIERMQLITDIQQSERESCDCSNGFAVSFAWFRPFPSGGLTIDLFVGNWELHFEYGLLVYANQIV